MDIYKLSYTYTNLYKAASLYGFIYGNGIYQESPKLKREKGKKIKKKSSKKEGPGTAIRSYGLGSHAEPGIIGEADVVVVV